MKTKLLALLFLVGTSSMFAGPRVFVGFGFGPRYYAPAPVYAYGPAYYPAPAYVYPPYYGPRYVRPYPAFRARVWVGPRYFGGRHYRGYWR
ncbi:MAG TPA: hypothetical protein VGV35_14720 [Bryobacteraceae bacterium]|nr:hypothetical protein [Bryobacteraceae bacterium]